MPRPMPANNRRNGLVNRRQSESLKKGLPAFLKVICVCTAQTCCLPILSVILLGLGIPFARATPSDILFRLGTGVLKVWVVCVMAPYIVHETLHIVALALCPAIQSITVESTLLRISIRSEGTLTAMQSCLIAFVGPCGASVVGAVLLSFNYQCGWFWLLHAVFIFPPFGDGASILRGVTSIARYTKGSDSLAESRQ